MIRIIPYILFLASWKTYAGVDGGGGFAVVCRDSQNLIQSAELLDLYEGREIRKMKLMQASGDLTTDYLRGANNTYALQGYPHPVSDDELKSDLERNLSYIRFLEKDQPLPSTDDLGETVVVPAGCNLEQVAVYYDIPDKLEVSKEIWETFDSLSKAALITHEGAYRYQRMANETTSRNSRAFTAIAYSAGDIAPVRHGIPQNHKHCFAEFVPNTARGLAGVQFFTELYIYNSPNTDRQVYQFTFLFGQPLLTKTYFEMPSDNRGFFLLKSKQLTNWTITKSHDPKGNVILSAYDDDMLIGSLTLEKQVCE